MYELALQAVNLQKGMFESVRNISVHRTEIRDMAPPQLCLAYGIENAYWPLVT